MLAIGTTAFSPQRTVIVLAQAGPKRPIDPAAISKAGRRGQTVAKEATVQQSRWAMLLQARSVIDCEMPMLSENSAREVKRFFDACHQSLRVMTFRYFAVLKEERMVLLSAELELGNSTAVPSLDDVRRRTNLIAAGIYQKLCQPNEAAEIATTLCTRGQISLGKEMFWLEPESSGEFSIYFNPRPYVSSGGFGHPELSVRGSSREKITYQIDELDVDLKAAEKPYADVAELLKEIGLEHRLPDHVHLKISSTAIARISDDPALTKIENGKASIHVRIADGIEKSDIRLGWRCLGDGEFDSRDSVTGDAIDLKVGKADLGHERWGVHQINVPHRASLQCFLSYKNRMQHEIVLHDSDPRGNVRWCLHKSIDTTTSWLEDAFTETAKKNSFERAVAVLFGLLGFRTIHYGDSIKDASDIVATTARGDVALIECTTDAIRDDKFQKLIDRRENVGTALIADKLPNSRILALVIIRKKREVATLSLDRGLESGVVTLVEEDLLDLLDRVRSRSDDHLQIYEELYARNLSITRAKNPFNLVR